MNLDALVAAMTPDVYERLRLATETGKWPDGTVLSEAQKESSLQAVMLYQARVMESDEHMTVGKNGEIVQRSRQDMKRAFDSQDTIARFGQDDL